MFWSPDPRGVANGSNPEPSSATEKLSHPSSADTSIVTAPAEAYFDAFCSASNEQK
jgi:hypothetical protein